MKKYGQCFSFGKNLTQKFLYEPLPLNTWKQFYTPCVHAQLLTHV